MECDLFYLKIKYRNVLPIKSAEKVYMNLKKNAQFINCFTLIININYKQKYKFLPDLCDYSFFWDGVATNNDRHPF